MRKFIRGVLPLTLAAGKSRTELDALKADGWLLPMGGADELVDQIREGKKAIDAKTTEVKTLKATFDEKKKAAHGVEVDWSNPEEVGKSEALKALNEAQAPLSKARQELEILNDTFQSLALMAGDDAQTKSLLADLDIRQPSEQERDEKRLKADVITRTKSMGARAIDGEDYKRLKAAGLFNDGSTDPIGTSVPLGDAMDRDAFKAMLTNGGAKALVTGQIQAQGGVLEVPQYDRALENLPQPDLGVFDMITLGTTDAAAIVYMRILSRTIRATEVPEATSAAPIDGTVITPALGGLAPESDLTFERAEEAAKTISHWIPMTREEVNDVPGLQGTIDDEMLVGVTRKAEVQSIQGSGSGLQTRGLLATPGIGSYTQGTGVGASGENRLDAIHRALTILSIFGFNASGIGMHPRDWELIRLAKDANGIYLVGPPSQAGIRTLFGVPVIVSVAFAEGQPVVGEWARLKFLVREAARTYLSDNVGDDFLRELLRLKASMRGIVQCRYPQAFCKVTFA